ncbi:MAG: hypothetical protein CMO80_00295 [Verrucomicrobiales bacterium]|nr:hypothetical protein [Verrucomicrobiales bacterium]|tara:strand:+ start:1788 stop:2948 length:1161 start_codon:yes stop_codon:yes gene_type:complete
MKITARILSAAFAFHSLALFAAPQFKWERVDVGEIEIGYGVQIADVNGDGKVDILLADKKSIQWYQNPSWEKHVIAKDLTERDNVCITARDLTGDGKCEIAVGAQWNPGNTTDADASGAVFYLVPGSNRTKKWTPTKLQNEPTVHRMHWIKSSDGVHSLVVKPLHGRGNKGGVGRGGLILEYHMPKNNRSDWTTEVVSDFMHLTHNFHPVNWDDDREEELLIAGKEGIWFFNERGGKWEKRQLTDKAAGEIRDGRLPDGKRFIVTIEPHHGIAATVYVETKEGLWQNTSVLDNELVAGHALQVGDLLGLGNDQIVVGWRGQRKAEPGIKIFTPANKDGSKWHGQKISGKGIAIEDLKVADLNGDGKLDIIAAGRATKNLVVFMNAR